VTQGLQDRAEWARFYDCNEASDAQTREAGRSRPFVKRRLHPCKQCANTRASCARSRKWHKQSFWGCPGCFQQKACACESLKRQLGVKVSGCYAQVYIQKFGVPGRPTSTADERAANVQTVNGTLVQR
jgi:hypothetical protein